MVINTVIFCDFDGTIAVQDVTDTLLNKLGPKNWTDTGERYLAGEITHAQMNTIFAGMLPPNERKIKKVLETIKVRDGFFEFVEKVKSNNMQVVVISGGWGLYIKWLLKSLPLKEVSNFSEIEKSVQNQDIIPLISNNVNLSKEKKCWEIELMWENYDCQLSSPCKEKFLSPFKKKGLRTIAIGNSESDLCMCEAADLVFATGSLPHLLKSKNINHTSFVSFQEISEKI